MKAENKIQLSTCPFFFDLEKAPGNLQMKLTDLQGDTKLKEMLNSVKHVSMFFTAV
jgi:hypothetical protein